MYLYLLKRMLMASQNSSENKYSAAIIAARNKNVPSIYLNPTPPHLAPHTVKDFIKMPRLLYYTCWFWYCKQRVSPKHTLLCRFCGLRYCHSHELPNSHKCTVSKLIPYPTKIGRSTGELTSSTNSSNEDSSIKDSSIKDSSIKDSSIEDSSIEDFETFSASEIAESKNLQVPITDTDTGKVEELIAEAIMEDQLVIKEVQEQLMKVALDSPVKSFRVDNFEDLAVPLEDDVEQAEASGPSKGRGKEEKEEPAPLMEIDEEPELLRQMRNDGMEEEKSDERKLALGAKRRLELQELENSFTYYYMNATKKPTKFMKFQRTPGYEKMGKARKALKFD